MTPSDSDSSPQRLEKELGLFDVYAICTGAMFASGFFLLPGIASAETGPSVFLAYAVASLLMIPTTLAIAELSATMPRAGGPYFFIDRAFGPAMGTIGGLGVWLVQTLKSAFALVGMGAYLGLIFNVAIEPVAVAFAVAFAVLNLWGAKQGARLQQGLIVALVSLTSLYVLSGLGWIGVRGIGSNWQQQFDPLFPFGVGSFVSAVAMIFVSFAGMTKIASVAEEVERPARSLPRGMGAALLSVTLIYVMGVYVMVATLPADELREDLTPVATSAESMLEWGPQTLVSGLVVVAAVAAFASTANAGLLGASRIPLAMSRDGLLLAGLGKIGRRGTPTRAILLTAGVMIAMILLLDVKGLARMASSFLLFVFALLNLTLIVMRESRIESYVPAFRVPLYPWTPLLGVVSSLALMAVLGWFYVLFLAGIVVVSLLWYRGYAKRRIDRRGAIYNVFARLAKRKHQPLEEELWNLMQEHGSTGEELYDAVVAHAAVLDLEETVEFDEVVESAARQLAKEFSVDANRINDLLRQRGGSGGPPISGEAVLIDVRLHDQLVHRPSLALVRIRRGCQRRVVEHEVGEAARPSEKRITPVVYAALFLVSPDSMTDQHRRISAALGARIEEPGFLTLWQAARSPRQLIEVFLRSDRFVLLHPRHGSPSERFIGKPVDELPLPDAARVVAVQRGGESIDLDSSTRIEPDDRLTIVGTPQAVEQTFQQFGPIVPDAHRRPEAHSRPDTHRRNERARE